eukprot:s17_g46.t1
MDPSQLAFIKQLIQDAEAKNATAIAAASAAKHPDPALDTKTSSAPHDAHCTGDSTESKPEADAGNKAPTVVPIATPCRTTHTPAPAPTGTSEAATAKDQEALPEGENSGQPNEKLKQFWSQFVVSPRAGNAMSPPQAKAPTPVPPTHAENATPPPSAEAPTPVAPTPAPTVLDNTTPEKPDEPMPPAPREALPLPEPLSAREQIRTRLMKLDSRQYGLLIEEAVAHPLWPEYFPHAKKDKDEIEDMVNWIMYRDQQQQEQHALLHKPTLILGEPDPDQAMGAAAPVVKPSEHVPTQPNIGTPAAVPAATPDCVQATLLRATTVDLMNTTPQTAAPVTAPAPEQKQMDVQQSIPAPANAKHEAKEETKQEAQQAVSTPVPAAKPNEPAELTPEQLEREAARKRDLEVKYCNPDLVDDLIARKEKDVILYWCWDCTTSTSVDRNSSSFTSSSTGAIRNQDAVAFKPGNMPMLSDPGNPKGIGKGESEVKDAEGNGTGKGGKGGKGGGKPKPPRKPKPGTDGAVVKTKTPEQESRSAAIAAGKEGESLLQLNQKLAEKIADYKKAAGHCKKHAPKAKPKASAKPAATPQQP